MIPYRIYLCKIHLDIIQNQTSFFQKIHEKEICFELLKIKSSRKKQCTLFSPAKIVNLLHDIEKLLDV